MPAERRTDHSAWVAPSVQLRPIGLIRTPFPDVDGMPIQSSAQAEARGHIDLDPALVDGLRDIEGFSHLTLIWHLHLAPGTQLIVTPFLDDRQHGIFATRAPARPNAIGISVVRLISVEGARLHIQHLDMVDRTPLLDIKPYVPAFDDRSPARIGWYHDRVDRVTVTYSDRRFTGN
jgi:tRNA-Thr(GGU) m(6)t(6)A37 methyltransferase TsaA